MDAVPLSFLIETLTKEVNALRKKLQKVSEQIGSLRDDLEFFKAKLEKWSKGPIEDAELKVLVKQFREAVYDAEDILDHYIAEKAKYESKNPIGKFFASSAGYARKLLDVGKNIASVRSRVDRIQVNLGTVNALPGGETSTRAQILQVDENYVVGFKQEQDKVINDLIGGSDELEVISIFGMPGLGKTTIADRIFRTPNIVSKFKKCIWVPISKNFSIEKVFLRILKHFTDVDDNIRNMDALELVEQLQIFSKRDNYLLVMDDVWTKDDWNSLKTAFPQNKMRSRILLTTRHLDVAKHASCNNREPITLKGLSDDESWELLQRKALGSTMKCPEELKTHGRNIANQCGGLPLAIVVMGGILLEIGNDSSKWEEVSKDVGKYFIPNKPGENQVIDLSFYQLLYPLKACFLYFGIFPKGSKIPVKKLIGLWIAEGFIEKEKTSLESTAKEYLNDLVNRSLVMVEKWSPIGKVKTCYVHDVVHEFCKRKAAEENLYHVVENDDTSDSSSPGLDKFHRISIHSSVLKYISSQHVGTRARSFLCSAPGDITLQDKHTIYPLKNYKSLRVLDGKPIIFPRFPPELAQLMHLRFLVLHIKDKILPQCISELWNLQTLIVHSPSEHTLEIKGDAQKMTRLRHLKTNASTSWEALSKKRKKKEVSIEHRDLTTLSMVSPETCTKDAFESVPNLNKLGIRGKLADLFKVINGGPGLFNNVFGLDSLENLKLFNDVLDPSDSGSQIIDFPREFPPNLKKLTLIGTQLDHKIMSTLGTLENLEILKLKNIAFKEMKWVMKRDFPSLKVLHIEKAVLRFWEASAGHFPNLRHLCLVDCTFLSEIPVGFAGISTLETIELERTTVAAARCAKEIEKQKLLPHQTNGVKPFKLSISSAV